MTVHNRGTCYVRFTRRNGMASDFAGGAADLWRTQDS